MRQTEGLTGLVHSSTDVFSGGGGETANCMYMTPQESLEYIIPSILFKLCNEIAA